MKILSFNVGNVLIKTETKVDIIVGLIKETNPDVIGLQEVDESLHLSLYIELANEFNISSDINGAFNGSFFNMLISKHKNPIHYVPFLHTKMNRGFLWQQYDDTILVNTHLENSSMKTRLDQANEIDTLFKDKKYILFGDTNLKNDECLHHLTHLKHNQKNTFTFDGSLNKNVYYVIRENLDRVYTNCPDICGCVSVLSNICIAEHFPILFNQTK